jgi:hypothetical protein
VFNPDNIDENTDDDASIWLNFEEMFNFNSLLHTMYTLFYVAMLGNWTFIMDAAARTERIPSLFYFYSFRLFMTLIVIPIMFAFIIQSYIAARDKEAKKEGTDEMRLSDHLRILGTYQFEAPAPSAVGDEAISEATIDRALMRAESKRSIGIAQLDAPEKEGGRLPGDVRSVTSYQMEGGGEEAPHSSTNTPKVRSEKDAIRKWNQGTLSVQEMFEAYASGLLLDNEEKSGTDPQGLPPRSESNVSDLSAVSVSVSGGTGKGGSFSGKPGGVREKEKDKEKFQVCFKRIDSVPLLYIGTKTTSVSGLH